MEYTCLFKENLNNYRTDSSLREKKKKRKKKKERKSDCVATLNGGEGWLCNNYDLVGMATQPSLAGELWTPLTKTMRQLLYGQDGGPATPSLL